MFLDDVEVDGGLGDLTERMSKALADAGAEKVELSDEQKKKLEEEADDGW